jgi:hypothetical protein
LKNIRRKTTFIASRVFISYAFSVDRPLIQRSSHRLKATTDSSIAIFSAVPLPTLLAVILRQADVSQLLLHSPEETSLSKPDLASRGGGGAV